MRNEQSKHRSKLTSLENVYNKTIEAFNYDKDKAIKWYLKEIPEFGKSPYQLCKDGKARMIIRLLNKIITN